MVDNKNIDKGENPDSYTIRPAGRHLLTIGRDLIQDQYAAVVELVKNAYDADSPDVSITLIAKPYKAGIEIVIADNGHGMSRETVISKWLVPSTPDKKNRKTSPSKKRVMQGRKGVGRYAASILGNDLLLETIDQQGKKTIVFLQWQDFEEAEYLTDVEILVQTEDCKESSGTKLTITGSKDYVQEWDDTQLDKLNYELKKLISPVSEIFSESEDDKFDIYLTTHNLSSKFRDREKEKIEPYPIFELYDYGISGRIDDTGHGTIKFVNQKAKNTVNEEIEFNLNAPTGCGKIDLDIRVYDREPSAIDQLIKRGLKDDSGKYVNKLQARQILNLNNGIGVYRNGFRIRPLGDADFDWLTLNEQRIQNPSQKIGSNQVIGYVQIESEEFSGLEEKSARDGLRENQAYENLKRLTLQIIKLLEDKRFIYRQKAGLSRKALKVEKEFERLFSFTVLKEKVRKTLNKGGISQEDSASIMKMIDKEEKDRNALAEEIKQTVAIYQGQATLGKIINVVLHEGRRPLNYFKNQIPNLHFWADEIEKNFEPEILDELIPISRGLETNTNSFVTLFERLDPLAASKRSKPSYFSLNSIIKGTCDVFENELLENKITVDITGDKDCKLFGWQQDFYIIFTNLIDNSIFWLENSEVKLRKIDFIIDCDEGSFTSLDYRDSGPGIEDHLLESGVIFDPEFSTKPGGTGLGLAIAGEAATRNKLELKTLSSDTGAYFRLLPLEEV